MRKIGILLIICFLFSGLPAVYSAPSEGDIVIVNAVTPEVSEGESFFVSLDLRNNAAETLSNIYVEIVQNSSFYPESSGSKVFVTDALAAGNVTSVVFHVVYKGGSENRLPLRILYSKGGEDGVVSDYIAVRTDYRDDADAAGETPQLTIDDGDIPVCRGGETAELNLTVTNRSNYAAEDVSIQPQLDAAVFTPDQLVGAVYIAKFGANGKKNVQLRFKVHPGAAEKIYPLQINFKYKNEAGNAFTSTDTIYIRVENPQNGPRLLLEKAAGAAPQLLAGEKGDVALTVRNSGALAAKDIKATLEGLASDGFSLAAGTNIRYAGNLEGGQAVELSYSLLPAAKMESGSYQLTLKLSYKDGMGAPYSEEQSFFLAVKGLSDQGKSQKTVPKIIIDRYSASPQIVRAGENFDLAVSFLNTSSVKEVRNIKIFLTVTATTEESGSVFTPVNMSNTFYIDSIAPKGRAEKNLTFFTVPDAPPKNYTITANIEYEDDAGNPYTATELIGVPVVQKTRLETSDIAVPPQAFLGQGFPVSLEFYNMGKTTLYNLMVKLEGNFQTQQSNYFVGNFEPGRNEYYDSMVIPSEPGPAAGSIVFSYDDAAGEHQELRKEFSFMVEEMPAEPMPTEMGPGGKPIPGKRPGGVPAEGMGPGGSVMAAISKPYLWLVLAAAAGGIGYGVRRKLAKRKEMTLDE